jgi:hypothetical protein
VKGTGVGITVGDREELPGYFLSFNSQTQMAEGFLPNGAYDIRATSFGQPPTSGIGRIEVAGRPIKAPPITLIPNGQISVIVRQDFTANDTSNTSPSSVNRIQTAMQRRPVEVMLRPVGLQGPSANLKNSQDENDDTLVLDNVQQGTYRVVATPHRGYVASMTSDGVDLLRQPLVVGPGGTSQPIQIILRDDAATLTGSISSSNLPGTQPDPDMGFAITCIPLENGFATPAPQMNAFSGAKFTITNLAPGQYLVLASSMTLTNFSLRNIEYLNPDILRDYESKGTVVTLTPGQKADIQVPLLPEPESNSNAGN